LYYKFHFLSIDSINCTQAETVVKTLREVSRLFSKYHRVTQLSLSLTRYGENGFFSSDNISVPLQLIFKNYKKHPNLSKAIWAHEYGHSVLDRLLERNFPILKRAKIVKPKFKKLKSKILGLDKRRFEIWDKIYDLNQLIDLSKILLLRNQVREIENKIAPLVTKAKTFEKIIMQENQLRKIMLPFHEWFADLVSVVYLENGRAMKNALYFVAQNYINQSWEIDVLKSSIYRDFTERKNKIIWWKPSLDPHHFYGIDT